LEQLINFGIGRKFSVSKGHQRAAGNRYKPIFMNDSLNYFKVIARQTFIKFLHLLYKDFLDNPEKWVNKNLRDFLEAYGQHLPTFLKELKFMSNKNE
jgi:hypothetical protein